MIKKSAFSLGISGFSCGLGAQDEGCKDGYAALEDQLRSTDYLPCSYQPIVNSLYDGPILNYTKYEKLYDHLMYLKNSVKESIADGSIPVAIGGDHSMAMATWTAVAQAYSLQRQLGLIWVDAHLDAHSQDTSPSGNYHGMPARFLLEGGSGVLSRVVGDESIIDPKHLVYIGIRSYEDEEYAYLSNLGVKIYTMDDIHAQGACCVVKEAMNYIRHHVSGFGVTIDIDAFDPHIAPGTGTTEADGLKEDFLECLKGIGRDEKFKALEIAEFNPHLDQDGKTAALLLRIIGTIFSDYKESRDEN